MASMHQQTGMRGVYLAAAELSARGYIVSPTSRGAFGADLLVTDASCNRAYSVQVKTNARTFSFWLLSSKAEDLVSPSHIYVLVNLRKGGQEPEYVIVPSKVVAKNTRIQKRPSSTFYSFANNELAKAHRDNWELFEG